MRPFLRRLYQILRRTYLLYVIPAILLLVGATALADWLRVPPEGMGATYVGRSKCIQCHQAEYHRWHGSHHDRAMDLATADTVLGDFADQKFTYNEKTSEFFREGDKFFVKTDGPDGEPQKFQIKYTFGVEPLQQYMVEMDRGRAQVLPFCWDTEGKRWFHIYQNERQPVDHTDPTHWTKPGQNWNHVCADCHSTNLRKNYDNKTDTFNTTYSEIDVSCEACHGPGKRHVWLAENKWLFWDRDGGYGLPRLKGNQQTQIETCARCHSHRSQIHPDYHAGQRFLDHYVPALLDTGLYHHDGQIDQEVYVHGSFQQSLMYRKGVSCTDCHDPHSTKVKFTGNKLCTQCHQHPAAKYDTPLHHHHKVGSSGSLCVECHMPAKKYMVVDPRRDHSLRIPRPDLSVKLGTPNACTGCHLKLDEKLKEQKDLFVKWPDYQNWIDAVRQGDEEAKAELARLDKWVHDKVNDWFGAKRRHAPHFGVTLAAAMRGGIDETPDDRGPGKEEIDRIRTELIKLAKNKRDAGPNVRATAVSLLGRYASPRDADAMKANRAALQDAEPLVRLAAVGNLLGYYDVRTATRWNYDRMHPEQRNDLDRHVFVPLRDLAGPLLDDSVRAVRLEAARVLATVPPGVLNEGQYRRLDAVLPEVERSYLESGDRAPSHVNLAQLYASRGDLARAKAAYRTALERLDSYIPAHTGLAEVYRYEGETATGKAAAAEAYGEAANSLSKALRATEQLEGSIRRREQADLYYRLGLILIADRESQGGLEPAMRELARATALRHVRARFVYATVLLEMKELAAAEDEYRRAHQLEPTNAEYLYGLISVYKQRKKWAEALQSMEKMVKLVPDDPRLRQELREMRAKANDM